MNYNEITNLVITKIEIKFYNNLYGVINSINNKLNINLKLFINLILLHICDNNIENINDIVYLVNLKNTDNDWYNIKVNNNETINDQCLQKRRPRICWDKLKNQISSKYINIIFEGSINDIF